jgi:hypothetical protein
MKIDYDDSELGNGKLSNAEFLYLLFVCYLIKNEDGIESVEQVINNLIKRRFIEKGSQYKGGYHLTTLGIELINEVLNKKSDSKYKESDLKELANKMREVYPVRSGAAPNIGATR